MTIIIRLTVEYAGGVEPFERDIELEGVKADYSSLEYSIPRAVRLEAAARGDVQRYVVATVARYA
jgi:hypothetical protein